MTSENSREYVSWTMTVMCEVNSPEDIAAVQEIIGDATTRLVDALPGRMPAVLAHGPKHELDLTNGM